MTDDTSAQEHFRALRVFLCHHLRDKQEIIYSDGRREKGIVLQLTEWLEAQHCIVWRSDKELFGGVGWKPKIKKVIPDCDLFVVCLTKNFVKMKRGVRHREVRIAQDTALDDHPDPDNTFIIPVRIDHVEYHGFEEKQYVNYYQDGSLEKLRLTLEKKRQQLYRENSSTEALLRTTRLPEIRTGTSKQTARIWPLRRIGGLLLCMALILCLINKSEGLGWSEENTTLRISSINDAQQSSAVMLAGHAPAFVATDIAAQRLDDHDPHHSPYQITIEVHNLRQDAGSYLFIDDIALVLDTALPPPSPLCVAERITNRMSFPGNYYRAVYLGQQPDQKHPIILETVSIAKPTAASIAVPPPASAPRSHVETQPGGSDYINIAIYSPQPIDIHFHIQLRYHIGDEEQISTLLVPQPYKVIFSTARNWQPYILDGSVYIRSS